MSQVILPYSLVPSAEWGIVEQNNVRGGLHLRQSNQEMQQMKATLKYQGMLCYVVCDEQKHDKPNMYQWDGEQWVEFSKALKTGGGIVLAHKSEVKELNDEGYEDYNPDLYDVDNMSDGSLIFVDDYEGGTYMQCVVTNNEEGEPQSIEYRQSINGFDPLYRCTEPVPIDEKNVQVGNLTNKKYTRQDLEKMSVNKILSYMMFKEIPPFITVGSGSIIASNQEVGTPLASTMFTTSQTPIKYGYVDIDGQYTTTSVGYMQGEMTLGGSNVKYGTVDNNKASLTFSYDGEAIPLYTSWGNPTWIDDEGVEHEQVTLSAPSINVSAKVNGYYKWNYYYNTAKAGVMTGPDEDLASIPVTTFSDMTTCASTYIYASNGYVTIGDTSKIGGAQYNTSFIYVILPDDLTIDKSNCKIVNGVTGKLDAMDASWITKTSITNDKGKMSKYYGLTVWQIAKSGIQYDASGKASVTNNDQAIKLAVKAV